MLFINSHLEAHWQAFEKRNEQWRDINNYFVHKKGHLDNKVKEIKANMPGLIKKSKKKAAGGCFSCCTKAEPQLTRELTKRSGRRPSERIETPLKLDKVAEDSSDSDVDSY